jgi:hypothetical protein
MPVVDLQIQRSAGLDLEQRAFQISPFLIYVTAACAWDTSKLLHMLIAWKKKTDTAAPL